MSFLHQFIAGKAPEMDTIERLPEHGIGYDYGSQETFQGQHFPHGQMLERDKRVTTRSAIMSGVDLPVGVYGREEQKATNRHCVCISGTLAGVAADKRHISKVYAQPGVLYAAHVRRTTNITNNIYDSGAFQEIELFNDAQWLATIAMAWQQRSASWNFSSIGVQINSLVIQNLSANPIQYAFYVLEMD